MRSREVVAFESIRIAVALLAFAGLSCQAQAPPATPAAEYRLAGERALDWTKQFVELGPREAGSDALRAQQSLIAVGLEKLSCRVEEDAFIAATPVGALRMKNIIARFGDPNAESVIVVSGHYDTLRQSDFVGANDGGSSAGLLMALAERLDGSDAPAVWLVFLDGEEATVSWNGDDHTYGSRHLAGRWAADGTAQRISALINVDMIGDADLSLLYEGNSDSKLLGQVWTVAERLGYAAHFPHRIGYIEDDHLSFTAVGIPSIDLIDFEYGHGNSYWHTSSDTMDKLSANSFAVMLHVLEQAIEELGR
jgi:glutaminyl-peptide cyclotransferase